MTTVTSSAVDEQRLINSQLCEIESGLAGPSDSLLRGYTDEPDTKRIQATGLVLQTQKLLRRRSTHHVCTKHMKARRPDIPRSVALSRFFQSYRVLIFLATGFIFAVLFLADRTQQRDSGKGPQGIQPLSRKQLAARHEVKFLESQDNLRHSNLLETPIQDNDKIFKGRPPPDDVVASLNKIGQGFLANVNTSDLQAAAAGKKSPPVSSKPLGYYFSKDIPADVTDDIAENNLAGRSAGQHKAALGYYFNRDKSQDSAAGTHNPMTDEQDFGDSAKQLSQQDTLSSSDQHSRTATSTGQGDGLPSVVHTSVYLRQNEQLFSGHDDATDAHSRHMAKQQRSPNEFAVNLGVEFRPLTISLNTDDV